MPSPSASSLFGLLFSLEQTQWWSATKLAKHQWLQLSALAHFARKQVPYYASESFQTFDRQGGTLDDWAELPLLSRELLQQNYRDLRANYLPNGHGAITTKSTSGSTGVPVKVDWSQISEMWWYANVMRDHLWHRRQLDGGLASIRHVKFGKGDNSAVPPHGMQLPTWGKVVADCFDTGLADVLSIHSSAEEQADWLESVQADYVQTYPSNLQKLCDFYRKEPRKAPTFQAIRTISEALDPHTRKDAQAIFDSPVQDLYSTTEVGYIAIQCPEHDHLHVLAETVYVEVIDDNGRACAPGEIGRVIVTPLHNFAMPLIRYDIGDYAEVGPPCDCGRNSLVLKRVMGRSRNLLTFPDGRTDWPVFQDTKFREIAPIHQFQFKQLSLNEIELSLVVERALTDEEQQRLSTLVLTRLGHPFDLTFNLVDTIARSDSGKYEDFLSLIR